MIRYVVTTYRDAGGANLSREGAWGNRPFTSASAAREAAKLDAGRETFTITQTASRRRMEKL